MYKNAFPARYVGKSLAVPIDPQRIMAEAEDSTNSAPELSDDDLHLTNADVTLSPDCSEIPRESDRCDRPIPEEINEHPVPGLCEKVLST